MVGNKNWFDRAIMSKKKRVLVVDDEPSVAKTVKLVLETSGFEACIVFSGEECLKKIEKEKFDLVLLDMVMPKMNGWQVFEEIRKMNPELTVAFLTVMNYSNAAREKLEKDGLKAVITKPFENEDLVNRVKHMTHK